MNPPKLGVGTATWRHGEANWQGAHGLRSCCCSLYGPSQARPCARSMASTERHPSRRMRRSSMRRRRLISTQARLANRAAVERQQGTCLRRAGAPYRRANFRLGHQVVPDGRCERLVACTGAELGAGRRDGERCAATICASATAARPAGHFASPAHLTSREWGQSDRARGFDLRPRRVLRMARTSHSCVQREC